MDALEHHRPALLERAVDRGADADQHFARLLEEAVENRSRRPRPASAIARPASKLEWWIAGMNSCEKNARIVWRMKSVEVTRVIPSR